MKLAQWWLMPVLLLLLTSCNQETNRIIVKRYNYVSTNHAIVKKMDIYENMDAIGWLNDHQILELRPGGIYQFDLNTQESKLVYEVANFSINENMNLSPLVTLSPDKKHLFFQSFDGSLKYYIMNLETKERIYIHSNQLFNEVPTWVNNQNLVIANPDGEMFLIYLNGKVTKVNHKLPLNNRKNVEPWYQLSKIGHQFFYVVNETLWVWNQKTKQTKAVMKNVYQYIPSPDKKQLAIVRKNKGQHYSESLILMDLNGEQLEIATGPEIGSFIWSDDTNKLAYNILNIGHPPKLYVLDRKKSRATLIAVNLQGDPIAWNPSGTTLLINGVIDYDENNQGSSLYLITGK